MILFASMTYTLPVQASDCYSHDSATSQDAGNDCHDGSDTGNTSTDCADCCLQHHGASGILGLKTAAVFPENTERMIASGDNLLHGHAPSGLLKPPRNV